MEKPNILLLGVEIEERNTFNIGLSKEVKEGLEVLLDIIFHEIR